MAIKLLLDEVASDPERVSPRRLKLRMVPVAVVRTINEGDRLAQELEPPDRATLAHQRALMHLFDVLIGNVDRHAGNQLWMTADWKLHLIDHSRSFRTNKKLPKAYERTPSMLSRELFEALHSLERSSLIEEMRGLLDSIQVKSLLVRRDRILAKIARDRDEFGDDWVFQINRRSPTSVASPSLPAA